MGWLYVPEVAGSSWGSASPLEIPTAPSVTLSGKPTPPRSWSRAWKKGGYIRLLSGTTLRPSTADAGVAAWISSLRDSRVSPSPQPGSAKLTTIADTSGRRSAGLSTGRDRLSSFWRTSQPLFPPDRQMGDPLTWWSDQSWNDWATELRRRSSRHRTLAHRINESGSLSWPTASARDGDSRAPTRQGSQAWANKVKRGSVNAAGMLSDDLSSSASAWTTPRTIRVRNWATPQTGNSEGGGTSQRRDLSREAQREWPTPDVPNGGRTLTPEAVAAKGQTEAGKRQVGLENVAKLWPTPNDRESIESWEARSARVGAYSRPLGKQLTVESVRFHQGQETAPPGPPSLPSAPNSHRLSPLFVETLMGWPMFWSSARWSSARSGSDSWGTAWSPSRPQPPTATSPENLDLTETRKGVE